MSYLGCFLASRPELAPLPYRCYDAPSGNQSAMFVMTMQHFLGSR